MKSWIVTPLIVLLIAAASYSFYLYTLPPTLEAGFLYGNGHIEGTEVSISAEVSGRVMSSNLVEGTVIEKDALLVALDARDQAANRATAAAEIVALEHERNRYREQLQTWQETLAVAERDLNRHQALRQAGVVTEQQLDRVANTQRDALGQVRSLRAQIAETGARADEVRRKLDYLQIQIDKAKIFSPMHATILTKGIEPGEFAEPGRQIAVLVDMDDLELKVYVPEAVLGKIRLNAPAKVRVNAFPDRYFDARVKRVDQRAQFTPRDINMPEERVRMVFGVVLALENAEGFLKPGMPADAWLRWDDAREWPVALVVPR
ncbi:MAG: HlyD family secretion protein [Porticoccaceae bacterium]